MQRPIYAETWHGIPLRAFHTSESACFEPAGTEFYTGFYESLESSRRPPGDDWCRDKRALGNTIVTSILATWTKEQARSPRILAIGAGLAVAEGVWLDLGYDVTLHDCQAASLGLARERFPNAPFVVSDARQLPFAACSYDIVAMLAIDYLFSRSELSYVLAGAFAILRTGGLLVVHSVSILSLRQLIAGTVMSALRPRLSRARVPWGWWRTPDEIIRPALRAGFAQFSSLPKQSRPSVAGTLRTMLNQSLPIVPPLRSASLLFSFRKA